MENLHLSAIGKPPVESLDVELVERKGLGHPDTLCDLVAENLSRNLSRYYLEHFGSILHHNVDKVLLAGGSSRPRFQGGAVLDPIEIFFVGRAVREFKGMAVPLEEMAVEGTRDWFKANLRAVDPGRHLRIHCLLRPGSVDLSGLFERSAGSSVPLANDTSIGVGFAPLTPLERTVLDVERGINARAFKESRPEYGTDVKVMGLRRGGRVDLTVACAFVDRFVSGTADYFDKKARLEGLVRDWARSRAVHDAFAEVNTADKDTPESLYLTVTGTSAEAGDDGQVGRGNRANGLITPYRPMTMEAAAGKNPVTHTGKLYQAAAQGIAERLMALPGVREAECYLVSQIGKPINEPRIVDVRLGMREDGPVSGLSGAVTGLVEEELARLPKLWRSFLDGLISVC